MSRLAHNTITLTVAILILSIANLAQAACSGGGGGAPTSYSSSRIISSTPVCSKKAELAKTPIEDEELAEDAEDTTDEGSETLATDEDEVTSPSDLSDETPETTTAKAKTVSHTPAKNATTKVSYLVVQESKPGTGLDLDAEVNPAVNRGMFATLNAAEETAEIWRDVMPGWEVDIIQVAANN